MTGTDVVGMATGRFHIYCSERYLKVFEYLPTHGLPDISDEKPYFLLWIGGLFDTFAGVLYVGKIAEGLARDTKSGWSVMEIQLSSSGLGFTTGDLNRDVEEIAKCVEWLRSRSATKNSKVVIMGHSTGSQDVLHYLYHGKDVERPTVDGAILQAPVSDRESLNMHIADAEDADELRNVYDECVKQAKSIQGQRGSPSLPRYLTGRLGYGRTFISASRFLSLASPDSPGEPSLDDLFSSDLSEEHLRSTFGVVGERARLRSLSAPQPGLLVLMSGADEYVSNTIDKGALLQRWRRALENGGVAMSPDSGVVESAMHNGTGVGGKETDLMERCLNYLASLTKDRDGHTKGRL